ncbi:ribonuclease HI [Thermocoleostomius sinensis]|uniref:Ribonuclease H n=1 Tax=Thermocoleostomius sinensis A174 TaxID=2016057 RepID=A0A9E8ZI82_9CYAN|nr:ribonuclease HI [Thermocoleostomius sinensis]WAL62279.1 ribonuclease HI [Thermocoleostomius sinensis A174]
MTNRSIHKIYTDGACSGNPGPGGWGTVVYFRDGSIHELGGAAHQTTNNRMEMQAAIAALEFLCQANQTEPVTLYTDSEYVKNGVTQWIKNWKSKAWKTSTGKPVLNQDLWQTLDSLMNQLRASGIVPTWEYVRGHSGDVGNDRCDAIARAFALGQTPALHQHLHWVTAGSASMPNTSGSESVLEKDTHATDGIQSKAIQSSDEGNHDRHALIASSSAMIDSTASSIADASDLPREVRVTQLRNLVETLHMADEIARQGYLITSSELADLMDVNASAVTSRGDNWVWRNWVVSRVRREGNQILWQLERVD